MSCLTTHCRYPRQKDASVVLCKQDGSAGRRVLGQGLTDAVFGEHQRQTLAHLVMCICQICPNRLHTISLLLALQYSGYTQSKKFGCLHSCDLVTVKQNIHPMRCLLRKGIIEVVGQR